MKLNFRNGYIEFDESPKVWTSVILYRVDEESIELGSEASEVVLSKFLDMVNGSLFVRDNSTGIIEGDNVHCVASFAEKHHTLYAKIDGGTVKMYVEDSRGKLLSVLNLDGAYLGEWKYKLSAA